MSGHRRKKGHAEEHHVDERWLVSYADMITVLMALFIVLYAMSTVDQKKYDVLKNSLATGFGVTKTAKLDANTGVVPKKYVHKNGSGFSATTLSSAEEAKEIKKYLASSGAKAVVTSTSSSVTVSLVGSSAYFGGNRANLRPATVEVLQSIEPILKKHQGTVTVEGHADPRGSAGSFGTDWNLAAARATSVLVWLVDAKAVDPSDITSISHGSQGVSGASAAALAKNRRVDIVLHAKAATAETTTDSSSSKTATTTKSSTTSKSTATATPATTATSSTTTHEAAATTSGH